MAVLVELVRTPRSGGHIKCWEHFAAAATDVPGLDLTVYVLGPGEAADRLSGNVRFVSLRPVLSTRRAQPLVGGVDTSDLSPFHPALARRLSGHDVWHLTHSLAFASTAARMRGAHRRPLVGSVHTDVPMLTRMYTQRAVEDLPGPLRSAARVLSIEDRAATLARRRRDRALRACGYLLASNEADRQDLATAAPAARLSMLRRGVDTGLFASGRADRPWLARTHGVPVQDLLVLFVGRVDHTKGAPLVAEAVRRMRQAGTPAHLVLAGSGAAAGAIQRLLGPHVTLLGHLPQEELSRIYASCDALAFPSMSETAGNVVGEAMSAGLPVVLPAGGRTARWLAAPGQDGVLVDEGGPEAWAAALTALLRDPGRRREMGLRARATVESSHPSWPQVLREDLLPVWRAAAEGR